MPLKCSGTLRALARLRAKIKEEMEARPSRIKILATKTIWILLIFCRTHMIAIMAQMIME
jgi:hypothetical protein